MKNRSEVPALVFFDIDGTLLDENRAVPASAAAAIRQLRANGHLAFINTGRCPCSVLPYIREVGFDGIVASCGTYVELNGEPLLNVIVDAGLLAELLPLLDTADADVWLEGPEYLYLRDLSALETNKDYLLYLQGLENLFRDWHVPPVRINKLSYQLPPNGSLDFCAHIVDPVFDLIRHSPLHGEMVPKGYTKATGIQFVLEHLGLPHSQTYAFGDSLNDLDMLNFAQHGIAMANSRRRVLAASDHITCSPSDDGIALGLAHFGLI